MGAYYILLSVEVSPDVNEEFQKLKDHSLTFIICNLNKELKEIVVEKSGTESDWDGFVAELPETECRWAIYDFSFEEEGGGKRNKIVFISWTPDSAKIKQKMIFTSSKAVLRRGLVGIASEIQATERSEVSYQSVIEKVSKGRQAGSY
ncbi:Ff.00g024670.m01.CDS01 [Fusarium sp. VM40]|nr:Ff.00g024670.m01.CDS01 [Fusarium sp. VM40]